ncbi:MAG: PAS domain-containing protein [Planctomycetaceae bacterium]|nr:PAS domain-containing protein [Planctomycetaceae bacterium]
MRNRRLIWIITPVTVAVSALSVIVVGAFGARIFERRWIGERVSRLNETAATIDSLVGRDVSPGRRTELVNLLTKFTRDRGVGAALFLPDGTMLADLSNSASGGGVEEVSGALEGRTVTASRIDGAVAKGPMLFVGVPLYRDDKLVGAVQVSQSLDDLTATLQSWWGAVVAIACVVAALATGGAIYLSRRLARSLVDLRAVIDAQGIDANPLEAQTPKTFTTVEFAQVADALGRMAERYGERIESIQRINNEQEAVLAGMAEGVLAIDGQSRVISLNRSAGRLLGINPGEIVGRTLNEVVRNPELLRFVDQLLAVRKPLEQDIVFRHADERVLQIRGTLLSYSPTQSTGAVLVLNDVSRLRRLENMRRDFAANVSHELKTPITSIKGFIETILDGATPEDTERFLRIIARQTDRLDAIIDDLLSLSRIEKEAEASDIALSMSRVKDILSAAVNDCLQRAVERGISFEVHCPDDVQARVNPLLLQQAVRNLLENAVKYSDARSAVVVAVEVAPEEVRVSVIDHGCGIAPEYHARLFERFFRVDKARSRKLGGTGLGLAIVKHIVLAHRGRVTVDSALGKGSTFTIHLPRLPLLTAGDSQRKTA